MENWENYDKKLIPVVIYQTDDRIILCERPKFNSSKYEVDKQLYRMLRCKVSIQFLEHLKDLSKERIFSLLKIEMDEDPNTIYMN